MGIFDGLQIQDAYSAGALREGVDDPIGRLAMRRVFAASPLRRNGIQ